LWICIDIPASCNHRKIKAIGAITCYSSLIISKGNIMGNIGYACLTIGVPYAGFKTCTMKNATESRLLELISHNLESLDNIIDYNIKNDIKLFRISSDIIPFASSPVNKMDWVSIFDKNFKLIGNKISNFGMRVSMHPGQYTVLNSPNPKVVENAIEDLRYHNKFLDALGCDSTCKIILHAGGVYGDINSALKRFITNSKYLDKEIKKRLVVENDDRSYSICNVLELSSATGFPVVYDNLHNEVKGCIDKSDFEWIAASGKTWGREDGRQKIHYSQQNPLKQPGAHTKTIFLDEFLKFHSEISLLDIDIMLEVKDKNMSAVKCINALKSPVDYGAIQKDWAKYKYLIMEKSQNEYKNISKLFNKGNFSPVEFYHMIEKSLVMQSETGNSINSLEHVWGYFKNEADIKEHNTFFRYLKNFKNKRTKLEAVKGYLHRLAYKYNKEYLLNSYYFDY
jgi:UV DNA damage endonuclease